MLSGPKLVDRKGKGMTEPLDGRSKMHFKRMEEDLERIKEDPAALTEYCESRRKEQGLKYPFEAMGKAMESHILSLGTSYAGIKRRFAANSPSGGSLKLNLANHDIE